MHTLLRATEYTYDNKQLHIFLRIITKQILLLDIGCIAKLIEKSYDKL